METKEKKVKPKKFYCSEVKDVNGKVVNYTFKAENQLTKKSFATQREVISYLKSLNIDATMWIREDGVFTKVVKTKKNANYKDTDEIEVTKFASKDQAAEVVKKEEEPVKPVAKTEKTEEVKEPTPVQAAPKAVAKDEIIEVDKKSKERELDEDARNQGVSIWSDPWVIMLSIVLFILLIVLIIFIVLYASSN